MKLDSRHILSYLPKESARRMAPLWPTTLQLIGSHLGRHGVTSALNWTMSEVGNLNASNGASSILTVPPEPVLTADMGPMMAGSVGQPSRSISSISLVSTPSRAISSRTNISYGDRSSSMWNRRLNGSPTCAACMSPPARFVIRIITVGDITNAVSSAPPSPVPWPWPTPSGSDSADMPSSYSGSVAGAMASSMPCPTLRFCRSYEHRTDSPMSWPVTIWSWCYEIRCRTG